MIKFNYQSEKKKNNKTQLNRINLKYSSKKQKKILNLKQRCNIYIYISPKIERKRERETIFFVKKNYAYNGKENAKFILKG